jgi:hypothetical protein
MSQVVEPDRQDFRRRDHVGESISDDRLVSRAPTGA